MDSIPPKRYNWIFGLKFYDRRKLKSRNGGLLETWEYKVRNSDAKKKKKKQSNIIWLLSNGNEDSAEWN